LAAWLAAAASPADVRARHAAAQELGPAIDLREDLSRLGDVVRAEVDPARVVAWATAPLALTSVALRVVAAVRGAAPLPGRGPRPARRGPGARAAGAGPCAPTKPPRARGRRRPGARARPRRDTPRPGAARDAGEPEARRARGRDRPARRRARPRDPPPPSA